MREFRRGALATIPLAPGIIAFGLLYGMMARQVGLSPWQAAAMSMVVHAGSSQFMAVGMWLTSSVSEIIVATLVINLRHLLMGASVAPFVSHLSASWKALLALWMSDESYAVAIAEYRRGTGNRWFFLGANAGIWLIWAPSGCLGALLGAAIPEPGRFGLDLIFPLAFIGLLACFVHDRIGLAVALGAGVVALVVARWLPGSGYVIVAGVLGSGLGLLLEEVSKR
jgi:4-azaleucine resistance transporter AzlC